MEVFTLTPKNDLEVKLSPNTKANHYKSTGDDPSFNVNLSHTLRKGWYEIKIPFHTFNGLISAPRLYYSSNGAYTEKKSKLLTTFKDNLIQGLVFLPEEIKYLRFDPTTQICEFSIENIEIIALTDSEVNKKLKPFHSSTISLNKLHPLHNLETISSSKALTHYCITGDDPHFEVELPYPLQKGWYEIKIQGKALKGELDNSKLYFDTGDGYNENDTILLPSFGKNSIKWLVYFPSLISGLRFDPSTKPGEFTIGNIKLTMQSRYSAAVKKFKALQKKNRQRKKSTAINLLKVFSKEGLPGVKRELWEGAILIPQRVSDYDEWIAKYDTITKKDIIAMRRKVEEFTYTPLISIVVPIYNPDITFLKKAITSVQNQAYTNWELCLADDASTNRDVKEVLNNYAIKDARIKVVFRKENGHISEASNSALELSTGEFIALLDQDDELRPHSLFMVVNELNINRELCLIYSDEDKIDENGHRYDHYFKPEWSLDLLCGQNYINHLGVYRASILKKIGGFRKGFEGSQDYDLLFRFTEKINPNQIKRIPAVLYHWRAIKGSTAHIASSKNYAYVSAIKAIQEHLNRIKKNALVENIPNYLGIYRVKYSIPAKAPLVSLIIPTKDKVDILDNCIRSIVQNTTYKNYEIILVDNNSEEESSKIYFEKITKTYKNIHLLSYKKPFNYSAINNFAVKHSGGSIIGLINNDIEVINKDWLEEMVSQALRKEIGAVGAKLYYSNDTIQHAGVVIGIGGVAGHILKHTPKSQPGYGSRGLIAQNLSAITAACLVMRKDVFEEVGGLNEKDLRIAFNDVDLCLKIREKGYLILWTPYAELYHLESISRGHEDTSDKRERFGKEVQYMRNKWQTHIFSDPYFNPNFSTESENYLLAFPPRVKTPWESE